MVGDGKHRKPLNGPRCDRTEIRLSQLVCASLVRSFWVSTGVVKHTMRIHAREVIGKSGAAGNEREQESLQAVLQREDHQK